MQGWRAIPGLYADVVLLEFFPFLDCLQFSPRSRRTVAVFRTYTSLWGCGEMRGCSIADEASFCTRITEHLDPKRSACYHPVGMRAWYVPKHSKVASFMLDTQNLRGFGIQAMRIGVSERIFSNPVPTYRCLWSPETSGYDSASSRKLGARPTCALGGGSRRRKLGASGIRGLDRHVALCDPLRTTKFQTPRVYRQRRARTKVDTRNGCAQDSQPPQTSCNAYAAPLQFQSKTTAEIRLGYSYHARRATYGFAGCAGCLKSRSRRGGEGCSPPFCS